ncbi:unnamed protein product, partial [Arabidopsis halleri]
RRSHFRNRVCHHCSSRSDAFKHLTTSLRRLTTATSPSHHSSFFSVSKTKLSLASCYVMLGESVRRGALVCFPWLPFSSSGSFSLLESRSEAFSLALSLSLGFLGCTHPPKQSHLRRPNNFRRVFYLTILTYVKKSWRLKSPVIPNTFSEVPAWSELLKCLHRLSFRPDLNYSDMETFFSSISTTLYVCDRTPIPSDLEINRYFSTSTMFLVTRLSCSFPAAGISFTGAELFTAAVLLWSYYASIWLTQIHSWAWPIFSFLVAGSCTKLNLQRICIVPPSRREVCWASDLQSNSWASGVKSPWLAYIVESVLWDSGNPANIMSSKPNFMCLVGLVSSFKESSFNQSSFMECLPMQSFDVLCCTTISSYYERSLTFKCQKNNLNLLKQKILRNSVFLPYGKVYLFSTLKIALFNISTVGFQSPSDTNP